MNIDHRERKSQGPTYSTFGDALSFRPGPMDFAVIVEMSDGRFQIYVNELPPKGSRIVAVWNGENWVNLAKIRQQALTFESLLITEWENRLQKWIQNYIEYVFSARNRQWEDFTRYTEEQILEQLAHEHDKFRMDFDTSGNSGMNSLTQ